MWNSSQRTSETLQLQRWKQQKHPDKYASRRSRRLRVGKQWTHINTYGKTCFSLGGSMLVGRCPSRPKDSCHFDKSWCQVDDEWAEYSQPYWHHSNSGWHGFVHKWYTPHSWLAIDDDLGMVRGYHHQICGAFRVGPWVPQRLRPPWTFTLLTKSIKDSAPRQAEPPQVGEPTKDDGSGGQWW